MSYFTDAISISTPTKDYTIFWNRYEQPDNNEVE